jgi:UDP-glucose 4-epimerase
VPRFVKAAIENTTIEVHGDGTQSRCFGHVDDVTNGLIAAMESPACFGQVINFGSDREVSINDLAKRAIEMTGSKSDIRYVPYDQVYGEGFEDMQRRVPSLDKAKRLLGYQPTRTLDDIINDVAAEMQPGGLSSQTQNA